MLAPTNSQISLPFIERRRIVLLDGESEGSSLTDHLLDVRAQFEARAFETVVIDLKRPGGNGDLIREIQSGRVRFCYGLSGFGAELSVTRAHGTASLWTYMRTPYIGAMPDSPVFIPSRHRLASPFVLFLYTDPIHLEIACEIGAPETSRALVGQGGLAPPGEPVPMTRRDIGVLYAKAGGNPEATRASWSTLPREQRDLIEEVVAACGWRADASIWHVAREVAGDRISPVGMRSDAFCHLVCECELFIRRARASRALEELMRLPMLVSGGDWAHLNFDGARAQLGPRVPLAQLRGLFTRSKIVLNAMPALRFSTHHRVVEGMLSGAAVASDRNAWLDRHATHERYVAFDWSPGAVENAVAEALADESALGELAERGRTFAIEHHDADVHVDQMLQTVDAFISRPADRWE